MHECGTIISTVDSPSTSKFAFVVKKGKTVHKSQFVSVAMENGELIGRVLNVFKTNRYFMHPEAIDKFESSGKSMGELFPVDHWEYLVAEVMPLGVFVDDKFVEVSFPPSPGMKVFEPKDEVLEKFFGLKSNGLNIGKIPYHNVDVKLGLSRLFKKHLAILAISGSGKSYLAGVLLEELLERKREEGRIATVVIDTHGEYTVLAEDENYMKNVKVFSANDIRIRTSMLSAEAISHFIPSLTFVQLRELNRIIKNMREEKIDYTMKELIERVETDEHIKSSTRDVLISSLHGLHETGLFGRRNYPEMKELALQGKVSVINLSELISIKKKQIIVTHIAEELFKERRNDRIPPTLLIIEEAHQFAPEGVKTEKALSRPIIETIAREGRKFNLSLCLISQRPIQLSTTALSQCNTHIILRVTNPYDLEHIGKSSEGITRDVLYQISSLKVGTGLIVGEAVNFPLFVNIRKKKSKEADIGKDLEEAAIEYEEREGLRKRDTRTFM